MDILWTPATNSPLTVEPAQHTVSQTGRIIFGACWVEQVEPFHDDNQETKETCQQVDSVEIQERHFPPQTSFAPKTIKLEVIFLSMDTLLFASEHSCLESGLLQGGSFDSLPSSPTGQVLKPPYTLEFLSHTCCISPAEADLTEFYHKSGEIFIVPLTPQTHQQLIIIF